MTPTEVKNDRAAHAVQMSWDDGSSQTLGYELLRGYCPCAHCQGHGAGPKKFIAPPQNLALEGIKSVGHYALQFSWSDGHSTGIYTFAYLRELGAGQ